MSFASLARPLSLPTTGRFAAVGYLPTYAAASFVLVLFWAGAPARVISFDRAWRTASGLGAGEVAMIAVAITLTAVLLQPLQLALVRVLEGGWPRLLGSGWGIARQLRRKQAWERAAEVSPAAAASPEAVQRAGILGERLRRRFPLSDHLVRPTALGNVLAAMEDTAGQPYGLDAVVTWPRLYPVLGDAVRALVDDRRDTVDVAARLCVTAGVTTGTAVVLLAPAGGWLGLALLPAAVAVFAYVGAVQAALAYAESVEVAFDLHRFDLLRSLHLDLPADPVTERALNTRLCDFWRQGVPLEAAYRHEPVRDEGQRP